MQANRRGSFQRVIVWFGCHHVSKQRNTQLAKKDNEKFFSLNTSNNIWKSSFKAQHNSVLLFSQPFLHCIVKVIKSLLEQYLIIQSVEQEE